MKLFTRENGSGYCIYYLFDQPYWLTLFVSLSAITHYILSIGKYRLSIYNPNYKNPALKDWKFEFYKGGK